MKKNTYIWLILAIFLLSSTPLHALTDIDGTTMGIETSIVSSGQQETGISVSISPEDALSPPRLILSEIFFDGSDERVEITNIGQELFSGSVTIKGVKSSDLVLSHVSIPGGSGYIRGDTASQIVDRTIIKGTGLGLSISDTSALSVSLFVSGELADSFAVDASSVSALPNNYGFEKVRSGGQLFIVPTSPERVFNISGSWIANPGMIWTLPFDQTTDSGNASSLMTGSMTDSGRTQTGFVFSSGTSFSGDINTETRTGIVAISEIHPSNDLLPEYIELHAVRQFSGTLKIVGLGVGSAAKTLTVQLITGQYLVLADSSQGFVDTSPLRLVDTISLSDAGEAISIVDLSGNLYTSALYTGSAGGGSWYPSFEGTAFSQSGFLSPGFSERSFSYLPAFTSVTAGESSQTTSQTNAEKESYYQGLYKKRKDRYYELKAQIALLGLAIDKAGVAYRKGFSSVVELTDGAEDFSSADASVLSDAHVQIVALMPDVPGKDANNEQVTITLVSGDAVDLQDFILHANSKKTSLVGLLSFPGEQLTARGDFGLVNKPACVTLERNAVVYDTFCYGQPKAGHRITTTGDISDDPALSGTKDFSWMNELSFSFLTGEVCAFFGTAPFSCISTQGVIDPKKKEQYEKKLASLQGKLNKKIDQYTSLQERYTNTKKELEAKRRKYYEQTKSIRSLYKAKLLSSDLQTKVWKGYSSLVQSEIKKSRPAIRQDSNLAFLQRVLDMNISALHATGTTTILIHGQKFSVGDIKKQYAFSTDPAVFVDSLVGQGLAFFSSGAAETRETRLDRYYSF